MKLLEILSYLQNNINHNYLQNIIIIKMHVNRLPENTLKCIVVTLKQYRLPFSHACKPPSPSPSHPTPNSSLLEYLLELTSHQIKFSLIHSTTPSGSLVNRLLPPRSLEWFLLISHSARFVWTFLFVRP